MIVVRLPRNLAACLALTGHFNLAIGRLGKGKRTVQSPTLIAGLVPLCLALCAGFNASAQVTNVDDTTSTPIPGAGHDYIHELSETVNSLW